MMGDTTKSISWHSTPKIFFPEVMSVLIYLFRHKKKNVERPKDSIELFIPLLCKLLRVF